MSESILPIDRVLDPVVTPEVAERITDLQLDPHALARLEELREKANEGQLSEAERAEYEEFVEANDLLMLLREKARSVLEGHG